MKILGQLQSAVPGPLDNTDLSTNIRLMVVAQTVKLCALIVSISGGFCLIYNTEARASSHYPASQYTYYQRLENRTFFGSGPVTVSPELVNWAPFLCTLPEPFQLEQLKPGQLDAPMDFYIVGARDFHIRTGLSPPIHFA